jgi:hypothetical protein
MEEIQNHILEELESERAKIRATSKDEASAAL